MHTNARLVIIEIKIKVKYYNNICNKNITTKYICMSTET